MVGIADRNRNWPVVRVASVTVSLAVIVAALVCGSLGTAQAGENPALSGLTDGLVGYWDFGACDGKTVRDLSPVGNDGTITDGEVVAEKGGRSLAFDGICTSVAIPERAPFGFADQFTAAIWVRPAAFSRHTLIFGRPDANRNWTTPMFGMVAQPGRRIAFGIRNTTGRKTSLTVADGLPPNVWVHLAVTYDGQNLVAFVDGSQTGTQPHSGDIRQNERPLFLGDAPGRNAVPFRGRVGELRLWKRALSPAQIGALFAATEAGYDRMAPPVPLRRDKTVDVAAGSNWDVFPTRTLKGLGGYQPTPKPVRLDEYGGWLDRPKEPATGFFYAKQIDGRWWLVDPDGYRFIHMAMNHVQPEYKVTWDALKAQYGTNEKWAEATSRIFFENGFNGTSSGHSALRTVSRPFSYTRGMGFISSFAKSKKITYATSGHTGFANECIPVFHPEFEAYCETYAKRLDATKDDPRLLGIFSDNELQAPVDLLDRHLALDTTNPDLKYGYDAAVAWLQEQRGTTDPDGITRRDRLAFIAYVFERYYRIVSQAIRRHDPNHLYIGSRINLGSQFDNPFFMQMIGKYVDVISVNYYGVWGPDLDQMARWYETSGKPVIISEWYAKAEDTGLANVKGAGWLVHTQRDRADFYGS